MTLLISAEPIREVVPLLHPVIGDIFITGILLCPEDVNLRRRYSLVAISEYLGLLENKYISDSDIFEVDDQNLFNCQHVFFNTIVTYCGGYSSLSKILGKRSNDIIPELEKNRKHGLYIGEILGHALEDKLHGNEIASRTADIFSKIDDTKFDVKIEKQWKDQLSFRSNVWRKFVNVAHLWAAITHFDTPSTYGKIPVIRFDNLKLIGGIDCESPLLTFFKISAEYLKRATAKTKFKPLINQKKAVRFSFSELK
jgi:hypothetical protein